MPPPDVLKPLVKHAKSAWLGCDWPTSFGPMTLNLQGLRSRQALLAAKATRGDEAQCWLEAAKWLESVETDAKLAADLADQAQRAFSAGDLSASNNCLQQAERLEVKYRDPVVYGGLRDLWQKECDKLPH